MMFPDLIHRASHNRKKKKLRDVFLTYMARLATPIVAKDEIFIMDCIPIPTCKVCREKDSRVCRRPEYDEVFANKGYNPLVGSFYIGYKLHVITTESGAYRDLLLTPGSMHDNSSPKEINIEDSPYRPEVDR